MDHKIFMFLLSVMYVQAYVSLDKEESFPGSFLAELEDRMRKQSDLSYMDMGATNLLGSRSLEEEQFYPLDYDGVDAPLHPSIRDQEYLRHSTLLGSKYTGNERTEIDNQRVNGKNPGTVDSKSSKTRLPAYCSPPNPCPVGYDGEESCLERFENTAAFSRMFQEEQDCMCDTEHMFDCPSNVDPFADDSMMDSFNEMDFNNLVRQFQGVPAIHHNNLVAKKFHKDDSTNPFLSGERLPVAAKKGNGAF